VPAGSRVVPRCPRRCFSTLTVWPPLLAGGAGLGGGLAAVFAGPVALHLQPAPLRVRPRSARGLFPAGAGLHVGGLATAAACRTIRNTGIPRRARPPCRLGGGQCAGHLGALLRLADARAWRVGLLLPCPNCGRRGQRCLRRCLLTVLCNLPLLGILYARAGTAWAMALGSPPPTWEEPYNMLRALEQCTRGGRAASWAWWPAPMAAQAGQAQLALFPSGGPCCPWWACSSSPCCSPCTWTGICCSPRIGLLPAGGVEVQPPGSGQQRVRMGLVHSRMRGGPWPPPSRRGRMVVHTPRAWWRRWPAWQRPGIGRAACNLRGTSLSYAWAQGPAPVHGAPHHVEMALK
jgi:hypothetical protein